MLRHLLHYGIHFVAPFLISFCCFRNQWVRIGVLLTAGILIDLDHLLADPIFDANRCSIGFHPLHSYTAIVLYLILFLWKKTRILGLALLIHILADLVDCLFIGMQF